MAVLKEHGDVVFALTPKIKMAANFAFLTLRTSKFACGPQLYVCLMGYSQKSKNITKKGQF